MLLTATSEVISLGAVLPFLGALSNANGVLQNPTFQPLWQKLEVSTTFHLVLWLAGTFGMAVILANILRIITLRSQLRFAAAIASELSCEVYRRVLYQPYSFHVRHSSNELIAGITSDISLVSSTILPQTLLLAVNTMIVIALVLSVVIISPGIAIGTAVTLGVSYWILLEVSKRTLSSNSYTITSQNRFLIKYLQEGLGGIRDVILERNQGIFVNSYRQVDRPLRLAVANNALISSVPRYIIEPIAMVAICTIAVVMAYQQEQLARVVPILGALALAANRLLPALQGCFASIASLRGNQASLEKVLEKLAIPVDMLPIPQGMGKALNQSLQLRNVWFRYSPSTPWVLRDLCLEIKANTTVGFIGTTGSGKSTTADLILGLLQPEKGEILVDGELLEGERLANWQRTIAHVPQSIFLSDATIAENIAFGVPLAEIDMERVQEAARLAQIADFIEGREGGYEEIVGERGIRLSGGQRQRIGIARALYKRASVIVLDEATSALDNSTEKEVMAAIEGLSHQLTVILIAHRLSTLEKCDRIFQLNQGQVCQEGDRDGDSPTNSATGGVVGATGGTDPAIVSTSIRSTG
ncbi:ABC transporter ATP-binding protein [Cylindrospermopsis raciborskii S07]|uniref:ABC transporter ATP-binding protein n=6 Tax=Cylindrospermopsis raciborskii TaxID=77022 RepID=A0A853MIF3_9CYAN|nr:ABC transporter ATP-binding protein [Cylindrospermopsis raciborskii CS-505]PNK02267.1 ABC transporter ATP-binding protein [Cylindrospermopsis raciborskii S07]PNK02941.1 ABC transporter ATP-binding protein [Cylindrospermopsis raciborskii S14]PNK14448.1 ABC transporter ATP-binding protein [Cylindrospermopsis raciborskii S05]